MTAIFRVSAWCAVLLIAVLSLVPAEIRPHIGPGHYEHFTAYFFTSSMLVLGYRGKTNLVLILVFLSALSGIFEILQLWIPGRKSQLSDFFVSSLAAATGVLLTAIALWLIRARLKSS